MLVSRIVAHTLHGACLIGLFVLALSFGKHAHAQAAICAEVRMEIKQSATPGEPQRPRRSRREMPLHAEPSVLR